MRRFSALIADPKVISHMESIGILVWTVHIRAFSKDGQSRISLLISTSCAVILTTALFFINSYLHSVAKSRMTI